MVLKEKFNPFLYLTQSCSLYSYTSSFWLQTVFTVETMWSPHNLSLLGAPRGSGLAPRCLQQPVVSPAPSVSRTQRNGQANSILESLSEIESFFFFTFWSLKDGEKGIKWKNLFKSIFLFNSIIEYWQVAMSLFPSSVAFRHGVIALSYRTCPWLPLLVADVTAQRRAVAAAAAVRCTSSGTTRLRRQGRGHVLTCWGAGGEEGRGGGGDRKHRAVNNTSVFSSQKVSHSLAAHISKWEWSFNKPSRHSVVKRCHFSPFAARHGNFPRTKGGAALSAGKTKGWHKPAQLKSTNYGLTASEIRVNREWLLIYPPER